MPFNMLSKGEVEHVAELARIELTDAEKEKFQKQLSEVLDYIEKLNEANTDNTEPTSHTAGLENITREDEVKEFKNTKEILSQAPDSEDGQFRVKKVL